MTKITNTSVDPSSEALAKGETLTKEDSTTTTEPLIKIITSKDAISQMTQQTSQIPAFKLGQNVEGIATAISHHRVLVDIAGGFITGIILASEMGNQMVAKKISLGEKITATVVEPENEEGLVVLSMRKASEADIWKYFAQVVEDNETITVKALDANKGGLLMSLQGIRGFLPVSQLSPEHYPRVNNANAEQILSKLKSYVGQEFKVKILTFDIQDKKLIFSEKKVHAAEREKTLKKIEPGMIVKGKVSGIVDFGAFITFSGLEGLLHISEISWNKVNNPRDYLSVGQEMDIMILSADEKKISLSMKRLQEDPWIKAAEKFKLDDIVEGPVTQLADYGAFIRLTDEVNGLLHITEMATPTPKSPDEIVKIGQIIQTKIIALDLNEHRVGLSIIALENNEDEEEKPKAKKKKVEKEEESEEK